MVLYRFKIIFQEGKGRKETSTSPVLLRFINSMVDDHRRMLVGNGRKRKGHGKILPK
jgi:hypothetical protein